MQTDPCLRKMLLAVSRMGDIAAMVDLAFLRTVADAREAGCSVEDLCESTGWSRATLYRRLGEVDSPTGLEA